MITRRRLLGWVTAAAAAASSARAFAARLPHLGWIAPQVSTPAAFQGADARCAAWTAEVVRKLRPISIGAQMNDENMPSNKGPYLSQEAAARLETMRAKYDPDRRFVSYLT